MQPTSFDPVVFDQRWRRPRPQGSAQQRDIYLGVVCTAVLLPVLHLTRVAGLTEDSRGWHPVIELALCAAMTGSLAFRRTAPLTAMSVTLVAYTALGLYASSVSTTFPVLLTLFVSLASGTAWARDRHRLNLVWLFCVLALVVVGWGEMIGSIRSQLALTSLALFSNAVYFGGARVVGESLWRAARVRAHLASTAEALAREQELNERRAVLEERLRIARELHDIAAHHISGSGIQAAAARAVMSTDPAAAANALRAVEQSSRDALVEMRSLMGVLREPDTGEFAEESACCTTSVHELGRLVNEFRTNLLDVRLQVIGDSIDVPQSVSVSCYRLVEEALVNVRRHSSATEVDVTVTWPEVSGDLRDGTAVNDGAPASDACVEVEVVDNGTPIGGTGGSGLGHVGMHERAALEGATVVIGPREPLGYRVFGRYPLTSDPLTDDPRNLERARNFTHDEPNPLASTETVR